MMLAVNKLNQFYGGSHILWDIDLTLDAGTCTCLMGRNGVGKTTLLRCLMGLLPVASGSINYQGRELTHEQAEHRARRGIGFVPQGRMIFPLLSVQENLYLGLGANRNRISRVPELIFELFPVLADMRSRRGGDLSGGQQQQLAIARALVLEPELLILDEPCEGIQPSVVSEIAAVLQRLNQEFGLTVLLVEQKLKFATSVAERFVILERGRNVASGRMEELNDATISRYLTV
jgi:urea transport system ATP-binding protein